MTLPQRFIKTLAVLAILVMLTVTFANIHAWRTAVTELHHDLALLQELAAQVHEVQDLRRQSERVAWRRKPTQDVLAQVNGSLAAAGVASAHLIDLREEADIALIADSDSGPRWRRQSMRLQLNDVDLLSLGRFLQHWQGHQPLWRMSRVELTAHDSRSRNQESNDSLNAVIVIAATYVAD